MIQFVIGVLVGAAGAAWYKSGARERLSGDPRMNEVQDRANAVLRESRMILQEARGELRTVLEVGRASVQDKAARIMNVAQDPQDADFDYDTDLDSSGGIGPLDPEAVPSGMLTTSEPSLNEPLATSDESDISTPDEPKVH